MEHPGKASLRNSATSVTLSGSSAMTPAPSRALPVNPRSSFHDLPQKFCGFRDRQDCTSKGRRGENFVAPQFEALLIPFGHIAQLLHSLSCSRFWLVSGARVSDYPGNNRARQRIREANTDGDAGSARGISWHVATKFRPPKNEFVLMPRNSAGSRSVLVARYSTEQRSHRGAASRALSAWGARARGRSA